ncbi:MAG TPA: hypothetical protein VIG47_04835 [Gemmatimonadaceae bacterium]
MKGNELVWRTLADAALNDRRRWKNVGEIADSAGVASRTGYLALEKLIEIGAVERRSPSGIAVTNPEKVLTVLAAWRNLGRDRIATTSLDAVRPLLDISRRPYAIGGPDAAIQYLDSWNNVSSRGKRLVYLPSDAVVSELPKGEEVIVLAMDKRAQRDWRSGYSSLAQTYADLFALPGWEAEEFRRALWSRHFSAPDWDQKGRIDD